MHKPQRFSIRVQGEPLSEDECAVIRHSLGSSSLIKGSSVRFNLTPGISKVTVHVKEAWDISTAYLVVRHAFSLLNREFGMAEDKPSIRKKVEELYGIRSRPWKVWTPEAMMELQYPTYAEALAWALLSSKEREMIIEEDFRQEGEW